MLMPGGRIPERPMPAALPPPDEPERLAALMALRILDTERTEAFDVFPALARDLFSVPISAVSFIGTRS